MNLSSTVPAASSTHGGSVLKNHWDRTHLYYAATALVMLAVMLTGFHDFYFHGKAYPGRREITPPIHGLVILHGIAMAGWVLLFLVQSLLINLRKHRIHRILGPLAAVLAAGIVLSGLQLTVQSMRLGPLDSVVFALTRKQFMSLGFATMFLFAGAVGFGLWNRRRPEVHRPMMLLATLSPLTSAIGRIDSVSALYQGTPLEMVFGPSVGMLVLGAIFFLANWWITHRPDKCYLAGYSVVATTFVATIQFSRTRAWDQLASFLLQ